jgi:hypothetical protein
VTALHLVPAPAGTPSVVDVGQLAADLRALSDGVVLVDVELVPGWPATGCDLCQLIECPGTARVAWWHGEDYRQVTVNAGHLPGWVPGLVIPDAVAVRPIEAIRVELARVA